LLVLHTLDELGSSSQQLIRLLRRAKNEMDWELCKELARFLMALDESGDTLRADLGEVGLAPSLSSSSGGGGDEIGLVGHGKTSKMSFSNRNGIGVGLGIATRSDTSRRKGSRSDEATGDKTSDYFSQ